MMKLFSIHTIRINYDITDEDVIDMCDEDDDIEDACEKYKQMLLDLLPQELDFEVECELEELDNEVCEVISDLTNYMINTFEYEIV